MSMRRVHLRKLLKIMFLEEGPRRSALRTDIREDRARAADNGGEGGGDFYGPFWSDAKRHVFGMHDLHTATIRSYGMASYFGGTRGAAGRTRPLRPDDSSGRSLRFPGSMPS